MADDRVQSLHYAAKLRGLSLIRSGEKFALVRHVLADASLDEIASYLAADDGAEPPATLDDRRADLRAMIKAERALLAQMEKKQRDAGGQNDGGAATEATLAEIRRRIREIQSETAPEEHSEP